VGDPCESDPPTAFTSADPPRNFTISVEDRIRALTVGVPAYAARKRKIEDREAGMIAALVEIHDTVTRRGEGAEAAARAVEAAARALEPQLEKLNAQIETHNRYYPIEANLRIDTRTDGYLVYGHPWSAEPMWTVSRLLAAVATRISERG
jgi:hypothetical protein